MTLDATRTARSTQRRASIFHGYSASPGDHWFGWLADQFRADGIATTVPALPNPLEPDPKRWDESVRADVRTPDENSIVVAHSLGCLTVLRYLHSLPGRWRLGSLVLVSGFLDPLPALPALDAFIGPGCDVRALPEHIDHLTVIRSDDDPLVPAAHTDRLAALPGVSVHVIPAAGHFLASDGFSSLPAAYQAIAV